MVEEAWQSASLVFEEMTRTESELECLDFDLTQFSSGRILMTGGHCSKALGDQWQRSECLRGDCSECGGKSGTRVNGGAETGHSAEQNSST